jgi:hypothetical protein
MVINDRKHVEAAFVCMLDLPHDLPSHVIERLPRGRLHFTVNPKSHAAFTIGFHFDSAANALVIQLPRQAKR